MMFVPFGLMFTDVDPRSEFAARYREAAIRGEEGYALVHDGFLVASAVLQALTDHELAQLGVRRWRGGVELRALGVAGNPRYRVELRWDGETGVVEGPWLHRGGEVWLLPQHAERTAMLAQALAGRPLVEVYEKIQDIRSAVGDSGSVQLNGRLGEVRVEVAVSVRLHVRAGAAVEGAPSVDIVPVLVGPDGSELAITRAQLEQLAWTCLHERGAPAVHGEPGRRVVLSPAVASTALIALRVGELQETEKRRFLSNPVAYLSEPEGFDEADYSRRVVGTEFAPQGASRPAQQPSAWFDDLDALLLQGVNDSGEEDEVWVASDDIEALAETVRGAREAGGDRAEWEGIQLRDLPRVAELLEQALAERSTQGVRGSRARPRILRIRANEVALEWAPTISRREAVHQGPLPLKRELQEHQREGLEILQSAWRSGGPGALLCDDMGLGKTTQALAFAAWAASTYSRRSDEEGGSLAVDLPLVIVAPPSLLATWAGEMDEVLKDEVLPTLLWGQRSIPSEHRRHTITLHPLLINSPDQGRGVVVSQAADIDIEGLRALRPDVLLIGYDSLRYWQFALGKLRIGILIADEAQEVKDPSSLRSRALRAMSFDFGLALTGTPVENSWDDLWALSDFAIPGRLGTLQQFRSRYSMKSERVEVDGAKLRSRLGKLMIRRTRAEQLRDLPALTLTAVQEQMPAAQRESYQAVLLGRERTGRSALGLLQDLAQRSLHPRQRAPLSDADDASRWVGESARTVVLWRHLHEWRAEAGCVLVFVRSRAMQETLELAIRLVFQCAVETLNGEPTDLQRQALVQRMKEGDGFRVLLVSPDVGGAGWNFQFARRSFLLERPFNPAIEAQMVARTHRIGQTSEVHVVAPVAVVSGMQTFDLVLNELLERKRQVASSVLAPAAVLEAEAARELASCLNLGDPYTPTTATT